MAEILVNAYLCGNQLACVFVGARCSRQRTSVRSDLRKFNTVYDEAEKAANPWFKYCRDAFISKEMVAHIMPDQPLLAGAQARWLLAVLSIYKGAWLDLV